MAEYTGNFGLNKPESNDFYDVGIGNDNLDVIDELLKGNEDAIATKATKAVSAAAGNLAGLDEAGNLQDSGIAASNVSQMDVTHGARIINNKPGAYLGGFTGVIKITFPDNPNKEPGNPFDGIMYRLKISGNTFYWGTDIRGWILDVYWHASAPYTRMSVISPTNNMPNDKVRFWHNDDRFGILIGDTDSTWNYQTVVIDEVSSNFGERHVRSEGWEFSAVTDISDLTIVATKEHANDFVSKTATAVQEISSSFKVPGGQGFALKRPASSTLAGDVFTQHSSGSRVSTYENGGSLRGAYLDLAKCAAGIGSEYWHSGNFVVEEGTWTPTLVGSTTAGNYVLDKTGYYSRIGKKCYITLNIIVTSVVSAGTGWLNIRGLPFVPKLISGSTYYPLSCMIVSGVGDTSNRILGAGVSPSSTEGITMWLSGTNAMRTGVEINGLTTPAYFYMAGEYLIG